MLPTAPDGDDEGAREEEEEPESPALRPTYLKTVGLAGSLTGEGNVCLDDAGAGECSVFFCFSLDRMGADSAYYTDLGGGGQWDGDPNEIDEPWRCDEEDEGSPNELVSRASTSSSSVRDAIEQERKREASKADDRLGVKTNKKSKTKKVVTERSIVVIKLLI